MLFFHHQFDLALFYASTLALVIKLCCKDFWSGKMCARNEFDEWTETLYLICILFEGFPIEPILPHKKHSAPYQTIQIQYEKLLIHLIYFNQMTQCSVIRRYVTAQRKMFMMPLGSFVVYCFVTWAISSHSSTNCLTIKWTSSQNCWYKTAKSPCVY